MESDSSQRSAFGHFCSARLPSGSLFTTDEELNAFNRMNTNKDRLSQRATTVFSGNDSFRTLRVRHGNALEVCKYNPDMVSTQDLERWMRKVFTIPINRTFSLRGEDQINVILSPVPCQDGEILELEIDAPLAPGWSLLLD